MFLGGDVLDSLKQFLSRFSIFRDLNAQEMERVLEICIQRQYRKKTTIFHEGDTKEAVFFIQDGLVKTYKTDENGHEQIVSFLKAGDMFPHVGFFNANPYPATAETLVDTQLIAVPLRSFEHLLLSTPTIAVKVMTVLANKIIELQNKLQEFTGQDVNNRALSFLLHLADKHGEIKGDTVHIDLPITHLEFANSIGTTRETVNRLLNTLRKENIIETHRNGFIILDFDALLDYKLKLESSR
jgi:CRP-like cAMP-binding protein